MSISIGDTDSTNILWLDHKSVEYSIDLLQKTRIVVTWFDSIGAIKLIWILPDRLLSLLVLTV